VLASRDPPGPGNRVHSLVSSAEWHGRKRAMKAQSG
jgi:hypothetical protein